MARLSFEEDLVYISAASVVGVTQRTHDKKRYTFQIDLDWSDGNASSSFRSYNELFEFQCDLLDAFPEEGGKTKDVDRTIPYLPGKKFFRISSRSLAEERLPKVQEYVRLLIAMPKHISRSDRVLRFFRSNWSEDRLKCRLPSVHRCSSDRGLPQGEYPEGAVFYSVRKDSIDLNVVQTTRSPLPPPSHRWVLRQNWFHLAVRGLMGSRLYHRIGFV